MMPSTFLPPILLLWAAAAQADPPAGPLQMEPAPPILIDASGNGEGALLLRYTGQPARLRLGVTAFRRGAPGKEYSLRATAVLAVVNPTQKAVLDGTADMQPGEFPLKITVSGINEAGLSRASLTNGSQVVGVIDALRVPGAYNVQVESAAGATAEATVAPDHKPSLRLLNSDSSPYRFRWRVRLHGQEYPAAGSEAAGYYVTIPGNGSASLDLSPALEAAGLAATGQGIWGRLTTQPSKALIAGTLKDNITPAELLLEPSFDGAPVAPQSAKILPFTVRERFWPANLQEAANLTFVFLLLCLGGVLSIWVNCGLPNTTRALAVRRRLQAANAKIQGLGDEVDSRWRVMLSARHHSLHGRLYETWWVFPSFASLLDSLIKDLESFEKWVQCAYDVSLIRQRVKQHRSQEIPPTVLRWIERQCSQAMQPIETGFTVDEEVQGMLNASNEARRLLSAALNRAPAPELEAAVAEREQEIAAEKSALLEALPPDFHPVIEVVASVAGQPMKGASYFERDFTSCKAALLSEYCRIERRMGALRLAQHAGSGGAAQQPAGGAPAALFNLLRLESLQALARAERVLLQMKQGVHAAELHAELQRQPPAASIAYQPARVQPGAPVRLSLRFDRRDLNIAAAYGDLRCSWSFGDGETLDEDCDVYHVFREAGIYRAAVRVRDENGVLLAEIQSEPIAAGTPAIEQMAWWRRLWSALGLRGERQPPGSNQTPTTPVAGNQRSAVRGWLTRVWRWFAPETVLEASRLLLVLAVAVIGLFAAAQEQVEGLTFLQAVGAVFALGFTAGALKNLMSERSSGETR
jgi:hypothetical protein